MPAKIAFISIVPSPYQRDLFLELASRPEIDLAVYYLEESAPDSPWPQPELEDFETVLPGFWMPIGSARCHFNWRLPDLKRFDLVVMNTLMSFTAQNVMRNALKGRKWMFWGERHQGQSFSHRFLSAPLHQASAIAGIGTLATKDYQARYPEPLHFNIPYHCDLAPFQKVAGRPKNPREFVFLFCGQMIARKGVDMLLEAFILLLKNYPQARLFLVGREAELPVMLAALPRCPEIEYSGFQSPENLPQCFAQADAFVLPSRHDGWGVVVNQALGAGLPIICSDAVGAAHDLIEPNVNGLMVPANNIDALYLAMKRLVENREVARQWGAASLAKSSEWTLRAGADRWINAIKQVLGDPA